MTKLEASIISCWACSDFQPKMSRVLPEEACSNLQQCKTAQKHDKLGRETSDCTKDATGNDQREQTGVAVNLRDVGCRAA